MSLVPGLIKERDKLKFQNFCVHPSYRPRREQVVELGSPWGRCFCWAGEPLDLNQRLNTYYSVEKALESNIIDSQLWE